MKFNLKFALSHNPESEMSPRWINIPPSTWTFDIYFSLTSQIFTTLLETLVYSVFVFTVQHCSLHNRCLSFANNPRVSTDGVSLGTGRVSLPPLPPAPTTIYRQQQPQQQQQQQHPAQSESLHASSAFCRHFLSLSLLTRFPPHCSQLQKLITKCIVVSDLTKSFFSVSNISIVIN